MALGGCDCCPRWRSGYVPGISFYAESHRNSDDADCISDHISDRDPGADCISRGDVAVDAISDRDLVADCISHSDADDIPDAIPNTIPNASRDADVNCDDDADSHGNASLVLENSVDFLLPDAND